MEKNRRLNTLAVRLISLGAMLLAICSGVGASAASSSGITYHGRIIKPDGTPLESASVQFKLQIRTGGAEACVMFEELQNLNMRNTGGVFSVTINDGSGARQDSSGYTIDQVFQNKGAFSFPTATCQSGSTGTTTWTPNAADGRKIKVLFKDTAMSDWEPLPDQMINFVPMAIESKQVGGFTPQHLLRVDDAAAAANSTPLTLSQLNELQALSTGASTNYLKQSTNGVVFPNRATDPASAVAGQIWFDTATSQLKYNDGSSTKTLSNGGALPALTSGNIWVGNVSNAATSVTMSGDATLAAGGALTLKSTGTAGTYYKVTTDAQGRVASGVTTLAETDLPTISTAGKVNGGAITTGTIGGNTVINTSGNVTGGNVSTNNIYLNANGFQYKVAAPAALSANRDFVLPNTNGANTNVLATDGSGNLYWTPASTGGIASIIAGAGLTGGTINTSGQTIAVDVGTTTGKIVQMAASDKLPAVDGSNLTNLSAAQINAGTLPIARGGTNSPTALNSNRLMVSSGGAIVEAAAMTTGQIVVGKTGSAPQQVAMSADASVADTGAVTVQGLRGRSISATLPSATGQVYRYDSGTSTWIAGYLGMADIRSTSVPGNAMFANASCSAGQALSWSSLADQFTCVSIAIASTQVSGLGTAATLNTGVASGNIPVLDGSGKLNSSVIPSGAASQWTTTGSDIYYNTGWVGIGTATPYSKLWIYGADSGVYAPSSSSVDSPGSGSATLTVQNDSYTDGSGAFVRLMAKNSGFAADSAYIGAISSPGASQVPVLVFGQKTGATSYAERMRIDASGNVGVGTTSPSTPLEVVASGSNIAMTARSAGGTLGLNLVGDSDNRSGIMFSDATNGQTAAITSLSSAYGLAFSTRNGGSMFERVRINNSGNVGVGTTSPVVSLDLGARKDAIRLPVGNDSTERPTGAAGMLRYNNVANGLEFYNGSAWSPLAAGGGSYLSTGGGTLGGTLTISTGGISNTGGLNNNAGGITNAGAISGTSSIAGSATGLAISAGGTNQPLSLASSGTGAVSVATGNGTAFQVLDAGATTANYIAVKGAASGTSPQVAAAGSDTDVALDLFSKGASNIRFTTGGGSQFRVINSANSVNWAQAGGSATGQAPSIGAGGGDSNIPFNVFAVGTGSVSFVTGSGAQMRVLDSGGTAVNYVTAKGSAAGSAVTIGAAGSDTNVGITVTPKGTGNTYFSSGNVGIANSNPQVKLDVTGRGQFSNSSLNASASNAVLIASGANTITDSFGTVYVNSADAAAIDKGGQISLGGIFDATTGMAVFGGVAARKENATVGNPAGYLAFSTGTSANVNAERMRISSSGKVGIGVSNPTIALDISGHKDAVRLPAGNDSTERPTGAAGMIRYNNVASGVEFHNGTTWQTFSTGTGVTSLIAGTGLTGGTISTGGQTIAVDVGTTTGKIVQMAASDKLPAVDGSNLTNLSAAQINAGTLPIARGGTNSPTALNSNRLMVSSGGAIVESAAMTTGQIVVGKTGSAPQQVAMSADASVADSGAVTVQGLRGRSISTTLPSATGQVYRYDSGTSTWVPGYLGMADIRSTSVPGNSMFATASCSAGQALSWSSLADQFSCVSISITKSQISDLGTIGTAASKDTGVAAGNIPVLDGSGKLAAGVIPSGSATQWTTATTDIYYNTGKVGIGTTSPSSKLHVTSANSVADTSNSGSTFVHTDSGSMVTGGTTKSAQKTSAVYSGSFGAQLAVATVAGASHDVTFTGALNTSNNGGLLEVTGQIAKATYAGTGADGSEQVTVTGIEGRSTGNILGVADGNHYGGLFSASGAGNKNAGVSTAATGGDVNIGLEVSVSAGPQNYSVYSSGSAKSYFEGSVGIGTATPSTSLDLSSKKDAIRLPAGNNSTERPTGAAGMIRYNTTSNVLEYYNGTAWIAPASASGGTTSGNVTISPSSGTGLTVTSGGVSITGGLNANAGAITDVSSQTITGTTASTSSSTGALVVSGGVGVAGSINSGATVKAATSVITPLLYGSTANFGNLAIESTSASFKGSVGIQPNGGSVGIGTASPSYQFHQVQSGSKADHVIDTFMSNNSSNFVFRRGRGTAAAPSPVLGGDQLGMISVKGQAPAGMTSGSQGSIVFSAAADYTDSSYPVSMQFLTVPIGSTSRRISMVVNHDGRVGVNTALPNAAFESVSIDATTALGGAGRFVSTIANSRNVGVDAEIISTHTASGNWIDVASQSVLYPTFATGITNAGGLYGQQILNLRNYNASIADNGTLNEQKGAFIQFGHASAFGGANPQTTSVIGLDLQPYIQSGNIGTLHDLIIRTAASVGGTVGTHWSIYQEDGSAMNYLNGKVGIGMAPTYKLDVAGDIRISGTPYRAGGDIAWTVPSDSRLKDVSGPYPYGLEELAKLDTIRFRYKKGNPVGADTTKEFVGVLAQDVQKVIPDAVNQDEKSGFLSLNTTPIFWALVNAVKDLNKKILSLTAVSEGHEARLKALEEQNAKLTAENARLKAESQALSRQPASELSELRARLEKLERARK